MRTFGKIMKFLGNFFGIILSVVLSLALVAMLIATPMLSGLSAFTRPETIRQVVQQIDFASVFMENFQGEMTEEQKKEMEFFVELTETQAFSALVDLYATDLSNAFEEEEKPSALTKEALGRIVNENMEELIRIIRRIGEKAGENMDAVTDAEIETKVHEAFEEVADKFLQMAPSASNLRKLLGDISKEYTGKDYIDEDVINDGMDIIDDGTDEEITTVIIGPDGTVQSGDGTITYIVDQETGHIIINGGEGNSATVIGGNITFGKAVSIQNGTIRVLLTSVSPSEDAQQEEIADIVLKLANMAKNGTLTLLLAGTIIILVLLICLLRWPRFKGLMWAAVALLVGAVLVAVAGVAATVLPGIYADSLGAQKGILTAVDPVIKTIVNSMYLAAAIYVGVAIVLIVLFVVFRKTLRKQKTAKVAADNREEVIEQIADEAEAMALETSPISQLPAEELPDETPTEEETLAENAQEPAEEEIPAE